MPVLVLGNGDPAGQMPPSGPGRAALGLSIAIKPTNLVFALAVASVVLIRWAGTDHSTRRGRVRRWLSAGLVVARALVAWLGTFDSPSSPSSISSFIHPTPRQAPRSRGAFCRTAGVHPRPRHRRLRPTPRLKASPRPPSWLRSPWELPSGTWSSTGSRTYWHRRSGVAATCNWLFAPLPMALDGHVWKLALRGGLVLVIGLLVRSGRGRRADHAVGCTVLLLPRRR